MKKIESKQKPHRLTLRLPVSLHEDLLKLAAKEGIPLNQYCIYLLSRNLERDKVYNLLEKKCKNNLTL